MTEATAFTAKTQAAQQEAQAALERLRARASTLGRKPFDWEGEWKPYRDEGRR